MHDERSPRERQIEAAAMTWVRKANPDCDSAEHWFFEQCKAFRKGAEFADANPPTQVSGDVEFDFTEFNKNNPFTLAGFHSHEVEIIIEAYKNAFKAGRIGMVSSSEVENLKGILRGVPKPSDVLAMIDDAILQERERCAGIVRDLFFDKQVEKFAVDKILNQEAK